MVEIGRFNQLTVIKQLDYGYILDGDNLGELLLPTKHADNNTEIGQVLDVFVYLDSEDRPIATTQQPIAQVGEFAYLQVVDTGRFGAFLDWGLDKDLLVPFAEQMTPMEQGHRYLVRIYLDSVDNRPTASSKLNKFLEDEAHGQFRNGQAVELTLAQSTDLGRKAIVNGQYWGLLFKDEVNDSMRFGQKVNGFIKRVRKDGRLDLSLSSGKQVRDKTVQQILDLLHKEQGFLALHDKSDPKLIKKVLGISKGAFKKAIGNLYKSGQIEIQPNGIKLVSRS